MKRILLSGVLPLVLLGTAPRGLEAQAAPADTSVPAIVVEGMREFAARGLRAALATWLRGSPVENSGALEQMAAAVTPIEAAYGRMVGYEVVRVVPVSPSVRRVYAVLRYERGPLYAYFDCYRAASGWVIPTLLTHTQASQILPADLLAGGR
jgi:hypothetical protein